MDNPKILVTGGTGFVGSSLVKTLVERNYAVKCLVKKTSNVVFLKKLNVELVYGDITDKQSLQNALKNVDVVYHIAGILGKWRVPQETYIKIHADGTRTVVNACIEQGVNRLIYCSTSGVLGPIETPPVNEYAPYNPTNAYENAKAQAEKIVLQQKNRLDITIIRPGMVYGPWDMHTLSLFRSIKKGFFFFIGDGKALLHPVFIEDLNQSFLQCLNTSKTIGEVYLIVGERYVTVEEFTRTFLSVLGVKRRFLYVPLYLAKSLARLAETLGRSFGFEPPLTHSRVKFFSENRAFCYDKAVKDLGYTPIPFEKGMQKTVEWYCKNGYL